MPLLLTNSGWSLLAVTPAGQARAYFYLATFKTFKPIQCRLFNMPFFCIYTAPIQLHIHAAIFMLSQAAQQHIVASFSLSQNINKI